jgi:hypothetical protein
MRTRTIIALFLAATLTTPGAARSPRAASNRSEVIAQSTVPMLTGTAQSVALGPAAQTNAIIACNIASYTQDLADNKSARQTQKGKLR